jgi:hypothetical protein
MQLWWHWYSMVAPLRMACARQRSFLWLLVCLAGICAREDLLGSRSIVPPWGWHAPTTGYWFLPLPGRGRGAADVHWTRALALLPVHRFAGKLVLLGMASRSPKRAAHAGETAPSARETNTKPPFIMGPPCSHVPIGGRRRLLLRCALGGAHP